MSIQRCFMMAVICLLPVSGKAGIDAPRSLRDLSDDDLYAYMGQGRNPREVESAGRQTNRLPANFWDLSPRDAALALTEANRSDEHRRDYDLVLEEDGIKQVPEEIAITLDGSGSACYSSSASCLFLFCSSNEARLVMGGSFTPGGAVFHNIVSSQTAYNLRQLSIDPKQARHVAHTILWLRDLISKRSDPNRHGSSHRSSTADGFGTVTIADGRGIPLHELQGRMWADTLLNRICDKIDMEVHFNLSVFLLRNCLTPLSTDTNAVPVAFSILRARVDGELPVPDPLVELAAGVVGDQVEKSALPLLERVRDMAVAAPADTGPKLKEDWALSRQSWAIEQDLRKRGIDVYLLRLPGKTNTKPVSVEDQARLDEVAAIKERQKELVVSKDDRHRYYFRQAIDTAIRQLTVADDIEQLKAWASESGDNSRWALQTLRRVAPAAFLDVLVKRVPLEGGKWSLQILQSIEEIDPSRAREVAQGIASTCTNDGLFVEATRLVHGGSTETNWTETHERILAILMTPETLWNTRNQAIMCLVPTNNANRYSEARLDAALWSVLQETCSIENAYCIAQAGDALCRRNGTNAFERVLERSNGPFKPMSVQDELLTSLADVAVNSGGDYRKRFVDRITDELKESSLWLNSVFRIVEKYDLRELTGMMGEMATASPTEIESQMASSSPQTNRLIIGKFHMARQIHALWTEPDDVTRAKLWIAYAVQNNRIAVNHPTGTPQDSLQRNLAVAISPLPKDEREKLVDFVSYCLSKRNYDAELSPRIKRWLENVIHDSEAEKQPGSDLIK